MAEEAKLAVEPVKENEHELKKVTGETAKKMDNWKPRTELGKKVKSGEIKDINEILDSGRKILEPEIVDMLLPNLESELLLIGQSKGKFGGGKRRAFRQTQKKTAEGNKPSFATVIIVGNKNGIVGMGYGKARETVPAREKALKNAKLNIIKIRRGCGSWLCSCKEAHTIPFTTRGKTGSVRIKLMPAPKGTGLSIESECQKVLTLAGIKDIWSKTLGQTVTRLNLTKALFEALKELSKIKIQKIHEEELGIVEGIYQEKQDGAEEKEPEENNRQKAKSRKPSATSKKKKEAKKEEK